MAPTSDASLTLPPRYRDLGQLGRGGNGEVRRVHDTVLQRDLAMKLLHARLQWSPERMERLRAEAVVTAQLQHPSIVPVHDLGTTDDGRVWFTMKEIRGTTLSEAIREVHEGGKRAEGRWTLRSLLSSFEQVCLAVAYAHDRGVVHRDLKPSNIMLGEFGEVLVVDWGLAVSLEVEGGRQRRSIEGTPVYMAPEQASATQGAEAPPVDAYALGAVLYELLSGHPPYLAGGMAAIRAVLAGPPPSLRGRAQVPTELTEACECAMAREAAARCTAMELASLLREWRDGERRKEEALAAVAEADAMRPQIEAQRAEADALRGRAEALLAEVRPSDPTSRKEPAWELRDRAQERELQATLAETVWLQTLRSALHRMPELREAHARLADHYRARLEAAEASRDPRGAAAAEWMLRQHDVGEHAAFLEGTGRLSLDTDPPGARVRVQRFVEQRNRLVPVAEGELGLTPLHEVPLAPGSYLLVLEHPERQPVSYPVLVERQAHWQGEVPIWLPERGELGEDECYVPAGGFVAGGDPDAGDSLPRQRVWVDGFVMQRFPVTVRQYLDFLNDLVDKGRIEEAEAAQPLAAHSSGTIEGAVAVFHQDASGRFRLRQDEGDLAWEPDQPVTRVHWHGAEAYARWKGERDELPWRLPNELEREKASRGVDGRFYPWGDAFDEAFARVAASRSGAPSLAAAWDFPLDESIYGVRGLAGNSRDWCRNPWRREGPVDRQTRRLVHQEVDEGGDFLAVRGGSFTGRPTSSRSAARYGMPADRRLVNVGLRLARSYRSR